MKRASSKRAFTGIKASLQTATSSPADFVLQFCVSFNVLFPRRTWQLNRDLPCSTCLKATGRGSPCAQRCLVSSARATNRAHAAVLTPGDLGSCFPCLKHLQDWQRERKPRLPLHPPNLEGLKQNQLHYIFAFHSLWCKGTVYPPHSPRSVAGSTNSILQGESTTPVTYCPGIPLVQERF